MDLLNAGVSNDIMNNKSAGHDLSSSPGPSLIFKLVSGTKSIFNFNIKLGLGEEARHDTTPNVIHQS